MSAGIPISLAQAQQQRCRSYLRMHLRSPKDGPAQPARANQTLGHLDPTADKMVVARVLAGDATSREALVDSLACLPAMMRVRNMRLGTPLRPHELEDAIQGTLLSVWRKLDQYDGRVPLLYWAAGFGVIEIRRLVERRSRRPEATQDEADHAEPIAEQAVTAVDAERLAMTLDQLGQPDRDIVTLKHFEELTFEEIGERKDMVTNTVKTRYYRALERLRGLWTAVRREETR